MTADELRVIIEEKDKELQQKQLKISHEEYWREQDKIDAMFKEYLKMKQDERKAKRSKK